ncbi:hypothetical protein Pst134EB_018740 [Puccinia striiformis f. sp. tritici]|nr:hypothetical protein Pst134EB_018740 [Puccinia striiformis f. sp. tritici]
MCQSSLSASITKSSPPIQSLPDNAVPATSAKGFDGRERSEESRYAREKEVAELKELLAKQNAKIEELEKNVNSKK